MKNFFLKESKQRQILICSKNCKINNFLAILELCTFYIEYKNIKFGAINFSDQTKINNFMQAQLLRFCKDTAKVSSPIYTIYNIFSQCKEEDTNTVDRSSNN